MYNKNYANNINVPLQISLLLLVIVSVGDGMVNAPQKPSPLRVPRSIAGPFRGRNCYDCNSEPWIPIIGRSLNLQPSHSYFKEEVAQPFLDQYGAPQGAFKYPGVGEVADFMLPPPYKSTIYSRAPVRVHFGWSGPPKPLRVHYRPVIMDLTPPPLELPLENHLPVAQPSDSYGRPLEPITLSSEHYHYPNGLTDVQVLPSVRIADYTASIEHPINLIQSPILDVEGDLNKPSQDEEKLSDKPIVVEEDTFTSASDINTTYSTGLERSNDKFSHSNKESLIQKLLETNLKPKTTKKLQIIVPYLKAPAPSTAIYNREYTTLAPVFVPPPLTTESGNLWNQLVEEIRTGESQKDSARGFGKSTTEVYNIHEYFSKKSLQQTIDDWTQQSYSTDLGQHSNTFKDHSATSSDHLDVISNEIVPQTTTTKPLVKFIKKPSWEKDKVTLKNSTHEKVYLVTPQSYIKYLTTTPATAFSMAPKIQNGQVNNATTMTRISVRVEAPPPSSKDVKVIFSEWPHLSEYLVLSAE